MASAGFNKLNEIGLYSRQEGYKDKLAKFRQAHCQEIDEIWKSHGRVLRRDFIKEGIWLKGTQFEKQIDPEELARIEREKQELEARKRKMEEERRRIEAAELKKKLYKESVMRAVKNFRKMRSRVKPYLIDWLREAAATYR